MRTETEVLDQLIRWAESRDIIRTMILTSSRADPRRKPDPLSDYDVEVYVRDAAPFAEDDAWVRRFGEIMVRWPLKPGPTSSGDWITQLVLYDDGVRIDFQVTALPPTESENLDSGYRVLVDKDGAASALPEPTHTQYRIDLPTSEAFADRVNAFWWDIIYVAKGLRRGELSYAKTMLDGTIHTEKLHPLVEWYIALQHEAPVVTGIYGRWFHRYLEPGLWARYTETFAGGDVADNWRALFACLELVRTLGHAIADAMGYPYPQETDRKVTAYIRWIRDTDVLTER